MDSQQQPQAVAALHVCGVHMQLSALVLMLASVAVPQEGDRLVAIVQAHEHVSVTGFRGCLLLLLLLL